MRIFLVQDSDRPAHVVAPTYEAALSAWRRQIGKENGGEIDEPLGVSLVADECDLIILAESYDVGEVVFNSLDKTEEVES